MPTFNLIQSIFLSLLLSTCVTCLDIVLTYIFVDDSLEENEDVEENCKKDLERIP